MACRVVVDLIGPYVVVVVFWSVELFRGVDVWVHLCTYPEDVEVYDVEDVEFRHDRFRV